MRPPLAARLSRFLVGCYPRRWRQRYAVELLEVLVQHQPTARTVLNLWAGAVSAHLDPAWRAGRHPMIRLRRWVHRFQRRRDRDCGQLATAAHRAAARAWASTAARISLQRACR